MIKNDFSENDGSVTGRDLNTIKPYKALGVGTSGLFAENGGGDGSFPLDNGGSGSKFKPRLGGDTI